MKRRVVQHGPSTLTISLPSRWVKERGVQKGDELSIDSVKEGLYLTVERNIRPESKHVDVRGLDLIIPKVIAALYKGGHDDVTVEYETPEELSHIHSWIKGGSVGFEIVDESTSTVHIRKVSELSAEEFKPMFRRLFHFLTNTATDSIDAARRRDYEACRSLVMRDESINKLADFCRRIVNKQQQRQYQNETALYHVIEELEKLGDNYKHINEHIAKEKSPLSSDLLEQYNGVNEALMAYHDIFFRFSLQKCEDFYRHCQALMDPAMAGGASDEDPISNELRSIVQRLSDLLGTTMMLHI